MNLLANSNLRQLGGCTYQIKVFLDWVRGMEWGGFARKTGVGGPTPRQSPRPPANYHPGHSNTP